MEVTMKYEKPNYEKLYNILMDVVTAGEAYTFKTVALDKKVRETGHLMAWGSYSKEMLTAYVMKYGYDTMCEFVKDLGDHLIEAGESEDE